MIIHKVDIKNLEEKKDELEITIESNQKEFRNLINSINRQCGEIEEINSELGMMKANVKEMKQTAKELVEFDKADKEKLSSVLDRLNEIIAKSQNI